MTEYVEDAGLNDALKATLTDTSIAEFSPLREAKVKILPLLKVTTNKEGEHTPCKGIAAQAKKVSDLHRAAGIDADYLLVVDYHAWNHPKGINPQITLDAMLHHALKAIKIEVKEGKAKFSKNDPDVEVYIDTVHRYPQAGAYVEEIRTVSDIVQHASQPQLTEGESELPAEDQPTVAAQGKRKK